MRDLLAAAASVAALVGLVALAALGLLVVPFVLAGDLAERRGLPVLRTGALQVALTGGGLLAALLAWRRDLPAALWVLPLLLAWVVPGALRLLPPDRAARVLGRPGRHE